MMRDEALGEVKNPQALATLEKAENQLPVVGRWAATFLSLWPR